MRFLKCLLVVGLLLLPLTEANAVTYRVYAAVSLIGGGTGALDAIDGAGLNNGDLAIVTTITFKTYNFTLDDDSAAAESSPNIISPDTNAGNKRWILADIEADQFVSNAANGQHFVNVSNSSTEAFSEVDGDMYYKRDSDDFLVYDGVSWVNITSTNTTLDTTATITLAVTDMHNDMRVNNDDDVIDYTLPGAAVGLHICFYDFATNGQIITVDPVDGTDTIWLDGVSVGAGDAIDSPANIGDSICLLALDSTNWITLNRVGTWVDGGVD